MTDTLTCETCRFWDAGTGGHGFCHRYPPTADDARKTFAVRNSIWPLTNGREFCGEHQPKLEDVPY